MWISTGAAGAVVLLFVAAFGYAIRSGTSAFSLCVIMVSGFLQSHGIVAPFGEHIVTLRDRVFLLVNEVKGDEIRPLMSRLKDLVTSSTMHVNPKNQPAYDVFNLANLHFTPLCPNGLGAVEGSYLSRPGLWRKALTHDSSLSTRPDRRRRSMTRRQRPPATQPPAIRWRVVRCGVRVRSLTGGIDNWTPLPLLFVAFLSFFVFPWPSPLRVINVIIIIITHAAAGLRDQSQPGTVRRRHS